MTRLHQVNRVNAREPAPDVPRFGLIYNPTTRYYFCVEFITHRGNVYGFHIAGPNGRQPFPRRKDAQDEIRAIATKHGGALDTLIRMEPPSGGHLAFTLALAPAHMGW